jgi:uncharacterized FlgJ-related protein
MFYKYDKETLTFVKDRRKKILLTLFYFISITSSFFIGRCYNHEALTAVEKELVVLNIKEQKEAFSEDKLIDELKRLNVRFPHIVMAQSIVETGHWKSEIFKENHNLFGMKEAKVRINTAEGTNRAHAYYDNWKESVYDYAFYQCRYLGSIKTEEEYYTYLDMNYAEAENYVSALKNVIEKYNLKDNF